MYEKESSTENSNQGMTISFAQYYDKVLGGWVGKCAGGILGAPIEGYKTFNSISLSDELFANNFPNDDLDLQVLWLDMVTKKGADVREADFTQHWLHHVAFPWNEYGIATRNIKLGLDNPDTGSHNNWYWKESMGSPIRSEIWGMLCPGDPARAVFYAGMDSRLDHSGFSVEAEQFLSACAALAFTERQTKVLIERALGYIDQQSLCLKLIREVIEWYGDYGFETTAGKIKSLYGDADFTSAPMNIGFTVLALLYAEGDFNKLIEALHLGHDSDCIVSTAGALLGLINGYREIPELWRKRVGDELLVSPEIQGIDCPETITQLAEITCQAGLLFLEKNEHMQVFSSDEAKKPQIRSEKTVALRSEVVQYPDLATRQGAVVRVCIENYSEAAQTIDLKISSPVFESASGTVRVLPQQENAIELELPIQTSPDLGSPSWPYTIEMMLSDEQQTFQKGIPFYGSWLLLGPFITDNPAIAPMDERHPDHGLDSMPSVRYMNHDQGCPEEQFINPGLILSELKKEEWVQKPFGVQTLYPSSMTIDLGQYFYGRGERTLYLLTEIKSDEALTRWLCFGCSNYVTVWLNAEEVFQTTSLKRRWPGAEAVEMNLHQGTNTLLVRLDVINDDFRLDIGLKEYHGKHSHQSHWDTELLWHVPAEFQLM